MDLEKIAKLQQKRDDYNTNPIWKKREYVPFPYPEMLEKLGYYVKNLDDYTKLEVYDKNTGEKLVLDDVKRDRITFVASDGRYFEVCDFGRISLKLPSLDDFEIEFGNGKSITYRIPYELTLGFENIVYKDNDDIILGTAKLKAGRDDIEIKQYDNFFTVRDSSMNYRDIDYPDKFQINRETMDESSFINLFSSILYLIEINRIPCNIQQFTLDYIKSCIEFHAQKFIDLRYDKDTIHKVIELYQKQHNVLTNEYLEIKAKYDEAIARINDLISHEEELLQGKENTK